MHPLVYHIASGDAFFTGLGLVGMAAALSLWKGWGSGWQLLLTIVGALFLVVTATPVHPLLLVPWCAALFLWLGALLWPSHADQPRKRIERLASWGILCLSLLAGAIEAPYHFSPRLEPLADRSLTVIADSITAGLNEGETTWPALLAQKHHMHVEDWSKVGETVGSALRRAPATGVRTPLLILEIGGNDLLGATSDADFRQGLDELLTFARQGDPDGRRQLLMFELPLPPFRGAVGTIQRELAAKHQVHLIPKRILLGIVAASDGTVDGLHLTQAGQNRMAEAVWRIIGPALSPRG